MKQFPNLTLRRVQRKNRRIEERYPQDQKIHKIVEGGTIGKKEFLGFISKAVKPR